MKIAWAPYYAHPLPQNHRFPMEKYDLLPQQLIREGVVEPENIFAPSAVIEKHIYNVHDEVYIDKLKSLSLNKSEIRKSGFPLSKELIDREFGLVQGSMDCVDVAIENGYAFNTAGGTHHAMKANAEGFCLINDLAVAADYALHQYDFIKKVLIVDLDVHQGNGTADIFRDRPEVFTFSMHGEKNYPMHKPQSDLDIGLKDGIEDEEYLAILDKALHQIEQDLHPDIIFYQSGVDVLASDKLGRLGLSHEGCMARDLAVFELAKKHQLPIVTAMGGGYSENITDILKAHVNTYKAALEVLGDY